MAWRRSGYRTDYGLLELVRLLAFGIIIVLFNQPEWVEQYRPDEKPAVAVLWDNSASMETRDVNEPAGSSSVTTRREAIEPLTQRPFWHELEERLTVEIQPFGGDDSSAGSNLYSRSTEAPRRYPNLRSVVLISDGDWNAGQPPVEAATALRLKGIPVFTVAVGSRIAIARHRGAQPRSADVRHCRQAGAGAVHHRKHARPRTCDDRHAPHQQRRRGDEGSPHRPDGPDQRLDDLETAGDGRLHADARRAASARRTAGGKQSFVGADFDS